MLFIPVILAAIFLAETTTALPSRTSGGLGNRSTNKQGTGFKLRELPIYRKRVGPKPKGLQSRGTVSGESGLGNNADLLYTVPIELGNTVTAVNLDTGSSDLWVVSDACQTGTCENSKVTRFPSSKANPLGVDVAMYYGDSTSGTYAKGTVARETVTIAGVAMVDQSFGAMNETTNGVVKYDTAGIFGLGFPAGSKVQEAVVEKNSGPINETDEFLRATYTHGPLLSRMLMTDELEAPMFTITLHRNTIDISGHGQLTVGRLPDGVDPSSVTWVPVRLYRPSEGGLEPPNFAPNEIYPYRWEIDLDGVYFDGERLPDSNISPSGTISGSVRNSALIDSGNSILRGPQDIVNSILQKVSPSYNPGDSNSQPIFACRAPHSLTFEIGGKMFPIDPRDFIGQFQKGDATNCIADNLVTTDAPRFGALFRWSLGDPFFRSNMVAFHYGNLTHPSVDPPRIGILSLVPENSMELYENAVSDAINNGGNFEQTLDVAPTASVALAPQVTVGTGVTHLIAGATLSLQPGMASTTNVNANADNNRPNNAASLIFSNEWTSLVITGLSVVVSSHLLNFLL